MTIAERLNNASIGLWDAHEQLASAASGATENVSANLEHIDARLYELIAEVEDLIDGEDDNAD